jgi:predicted SprT family Zn-dependent metalloprotease
MDRAELLCVKLDREVQIKLLRDRLESWGRLWGVPTLAEDVELHLSSRLRTSLGNYRVDRSQLTLAAWLLDGPTALVEHVLCHEAAHAAVHALHGRRVKPHGVEWRIMMVQAGWPARVRVPWSALPASRRVAPHHRGLWEHRCPVCQATRLARTRVTRWRCRSCRNAGRDGRLVIRRLPSVIGIDR